MINCAVLNFDNQRSLCAHSADIGIECFSNILIFEYVQESNVVSITPNLLYAGNTFELNQRDVEVTIRASIRCF